MRNKTILLMLGASCWLAGCTKEHTTDSGGDDTDTSDTDTNDTDTNDTDTDTNGGGGCDSIADACPGELGDLSALDVSAEDAIETPGDRDYFSFPLTEGSYYWFYVAGGGDNGNPDTVMQIYDPSGNLIGENDDLAYRINGTDSGFVLRATETGTYTVEVLEWSDWAGDTPQGGGSFTYQLFVAPTDDFLPPDPNEDANDDNDTIDQARTDIEDAAYPFYADLWTQVLGQDTNYYVAPGAIDGPGDEDWLGMGLDTIDYGLIEMSFYPGIPTDLDAVFEIVDDNGNVVASTDDPEISPEYLGVTYNTGLTYLVTTAGNYYLHIKSTDPSAGGVGDWYYVIGNIYGLNTDVVVNSETDSTIEVDPKVANTTVPMTESSTSGLFYGYFTGRLDTADDAWDAFALPDGAQDQYLSVNLETMGVGSSLDAKITVYDSAGNVVTSASTNADYTDVPDDPSLHDYYVSASGPLYVVIERENGATGDSAYYLGNVYVSDSKVYSN